MKNKILWILLVAVIVGLPIYGERICSRDVVCVITKQQGDVIDFYVENLKTYDITLTLEFTIFKNLRSDVPVPYTESFSGKKKVKIFTLRPVDKTKKWQYRYTFYWTFGPLYARHDNSYIYQLPYGKDEEYRVTQGFNGSFSHTGDNQYAIDWGMSEGTPIHAAREGIVTGVEERYSEGGAEEKYRNLANFVMIKHSDGTIGEYVHLKKDGVVVNVGQKIVKGQLIGYSGNVGFSSGPHLHFFVYKALNGQKRQSFPIKFHTARGIVTLLTNNSYRHSSNATIVTKELPTIRHYSPKLEYQNIRLFESGPTPPERSKRKYQSRFVKVDTRYIFYEVYLKNLLWNIRDNKIQLTAKFYGPDGSIIGEPVLDYIIPMDWDYTYLWHGWGWEQKNNWQPGNYRVELFFEQKKLCEKYFTVVDQLKPKTVQYQSLKFFEADGNPPARSQRKYSMNFAKSSTRYIYYEVYVKNLFWQKKDNPVKLKAKFYNPDGSIMGEPMLHYTIPKNWDYAYLWHGWGWEKQDQWQPGTYRFELFQGDKRLTQKSFTITEVHQKKETVEYQSIQLFESASTPPALSARTYSTNFDKNNTRYVFYEIYFKNLLWKKNSNKVKLIAKYYYPDGTLMGEPVLDYTIPKDWEYTYLWHGWGWNESGYWKPGTYRIELYIDNKQIVKKYFNVY